MSDWSFRGGRKPDVGIRCPSPLHYGKKGMRIATTPTGSRNDRTDTFPDFCYASLSTVQGTRRQQAAALRFTAVNAAHRVGADALGSPLQSMKCRGKPLCKTGRQGRRRQAAR